jgi:hypothetical protein
MPRIPQPAGGRRFPWQEHSCEKRAKIIYNKLRVKHGFGLKCIYPGWDYIIYSDREGWLVEWERAVLKGKSSALVLSKLNRRVGQLRRPCVPDGQAKGTCELETFNLLKGLVRRDQQLRELVDF